MSARRILVTGGAGYIGSHTVKLLLKRGYEVSVLDNLSRGHRHAAGAAKLYELDLADTDAVEQLLRETRTEAVIHFAAYIAVGESMRVPGLYFANNVGGSLSLLQAMVRASVKCLVFSSTAAVYGMPHAFPILESFPIQPVNPYGESKVMVERILHWFDEVHGVRSIALRYFNASGADPDGDIGEEHDPETHLIPLVLRAVMTGQPVTIFGDDYDTPDGTCIRDYIHVNDLAEAHIRAIDALMEGCRSEQYNVGTGLGYSVREIIRTVEKVTGRTVPYMIGARREGDPPVLVAGSEKLQRELNWTPQYTDLRQIVETAWNYTQKHLLAPK